MTTEEKAMQYAEKRLRTAYPNMTQSRLDKAVDLFDTYDMAQAYEDGATEALESQWKDPKVELPEDGEWVIIVAGEDDIQTAVWNATHQCWDDDEGDDAKYEKDVVTMWMPIPEPPVKGGEE